ncbi:N-acetylmuramoyl-L-alanine amidase [Sporosarcina sp. ANT_H38]|uniref:N-acetylmuramoyl-L-alanine amidase family protein n=1 Tax=Sporosarcina sp. ANT_H38 TaxID=2597358 RepID=UPI0011F3AE53|nr:N-acetylmuramoyl-L-alanine amidase [Sporosarcina sp. ANT_H38]KAA0941629.1 N-acetylmuramoyl-L-alanine amidase [Sporosarcina sp. ANT_H38]
MAKIKIDPGHGAHDPGALGKDSKEKDNVLKVAIRLKTLLENHGHTVSLTRSTDVFIPLSERAKQANNWGADYFVSLHNNAATSSATGFETFIHNGPVQSKTIEFQNAVHDAIIQGIGIRDRGKKRADYAVLRDTKMPAVLIEYAFISNDSDERILINEVEMLAQLTANGIVNYAGSSKPTTPPKEEEVRMFQPSSATLKTAYEQFLTGAIKDGTIADKWLTAFKADKLSLDDAIALKVIVDQRKK